MRLATVEMKTDLQPNTKLSYPVLVQQDTDGIWVARVVGWDDCQARGSSREAVLADLMQLFQAKLSAAEILQFEVSETQPANPLVQVAGILKDDPDFDEVVAAIAAYRREIDAVMQEEAAIIPANEDR